MANGWSWENDFFKKVSKKAYGNTYDEKLKNTESALGRTDGQTRMFQDYMNSLAPARPKKIRQSDYKDINTLSKWDQEIAAADKKRKEKEQAAKKKKQQQQKQQKELEKQLQPAQQKNLLPQPKKQPQNVWEDLKSIGQLAKETINPFDNIDAGEALQRYADRGLSSGYKEIQRGANRAVDSASFGVMGGADKKMLGTTPDYLQTRKVGQGGVTDYITSGLGYLVPGAAGYKALNSTRVGLGLTKFGTTELAKEATKKEIAKAVGKRLLSEGAKGGLVGLGTSVPEVVGKEILNPNDQNWKDNAKYIVQNTALGAVADPLFYGVGKGFSKGMESASNSAMKKLLPNQEELAKAISSNVSKTDKVNFKLNRPLKTVEVPTPKIEAPPVLPTNEVVHNASTEPLVNTPKKIINPGEEQLYEQAKQHVINNQSVSVSSLQKQLKIGYTKASRIIDQMESDGIVGKYEGNAPRKVLVQPGETQKQTDVLQQSNVQPLQQAETLPNTNTPPQPVIKQEVPVNTPQTPLQRPENLHYVEGERKHYNTLANSEKAPNEFVDGIKNLDRRIANTISDKDAADFANGLVNRDMEEAIQFVKNAEIRDKRHTVTGFRVIDELNKRGDYERAVDMADVLAKEGTKFGQGLQAFSVYNRLTPEGVLVRAQRTITKANATLPADKQIVMTPKIAEDLVAAADSIQRLTGQQEIGNNVISLLEKSKKGTKLTDAELKTVRSFMADAKKYIGDVDPNVKPPKIKPIKEVRTRDKIVDFMDKREQHAREELRKIMGRANAFPVDAFYYMAEIGASKIAKGTVKLADFTEEMVKDFGEMVRPYAQQLYNKAVENFNIASDKITPKRLTQAEKLVNKALEDQTLNPDTADELIRLTKQLVNASDDAKLEASMNLQMVLNKLEQPTFAQMISSAHYQAMLLNPLTMVRNIIGNEISYMAEQTSKLTAIPIDWATSKITGAPRTTVFRWNDFINPIKDYSKGFKIGGKAGWNGVSPFGINSAYDIKSLAFSSEAQNMNWAKKVLVSKANPLHWTEKMLGAMMRSFDTAGYMRAYNQSLRDQALVKAMNEGLKGQALKNAAEQYFRQADENMIAIADHYGKYLTFQDHSALGKGMTVAKEKMNELSTYAMTLGLGKTKEYGLGNFIIPFPKTPANLIMRAIEYSPAGLLRSVNLLKNYLRVEKNPMVAREAQLALSRSIIGTFGFSYLGYILADKGVLTSSGNSDYNVRELEKMAGKQGNSVNVSALQRFVFGGFNMKDLDMRKGDTLVSYDWAQPISISLSLGTGVNQSYKEAKNPTFTDRLVNAGDSAANTIINMSSLAGINRLVSGPPNEGWSEKIAGTLASAGGSFVPTLLNQFRKVNDNTARNTNDPTFGEKFVNGAQNRVPGWEKKLPASYNPFGEKKELYPNKSNNLFNIFLNPSYVNKYNPTKEEKFLLDYINKTGDKSVAPNVAPKTIKVMGKDNKLSETVKMTGSEQSKYQRIYGQYFKKALQQELPYLMNADQKEIEDTLDKISREAGGEARNAIREGRK